MMRYMHDCDVFDDKCRKCRVFPICWGGCAYRRYRNMFEEGSSRYARRYVTRSCSSA